VLNSSCVILSVVTGILHLATCYLVATPSLLSVVICVSAGMKMRVYQSVVQQLSIPRFHGNVLSEAPRSRWSYFGFQASCHNRFLHVYSPKRIDKVQLGEFVA
jgi:hypothetical protein